jgi:hypothetical protein
MKKAAGTASRSFALIARLPALNSKTRFAIDSVKVGPTTYIIRGLQPQIDVPADSLVTVGGWAVDDRAQGAAKGVSVFVDGGRAVEAQYGIRRDDVAKALGNAAYAPSGFSATIDTEGLKAGPHELTFAVIDKPGTGAYRLPTRVQFTIQ